MNRHTNRHHANAPASEQVGFTLVEVLVALVILSIGLLGVAKLVLGAVKSDDSAYMRSQATQFAYALLDQMRANQSAAVAGNYTFADTSAVGNPGVTCTAAGCSAQQIALVDVYTWQTRLALAVPAGKGAINVQANTPSTGSTLVTVTVSWDDNIAQWANGQASTVTSAPTSLVLTTQL